MNNLVEVSSTHSTPSGEKTDGDARRKIKTKRPQGDHGCG